MRHHLFYHESQLECSCSGNNKRFKEDGVTPVNTTTQIPLYQQLATFLNNKDSREQLLYRAKTEETRQLNVYRDVFDGDVYQLEYWTMCRPEFRKLVEWPTDL